MNRLLRILCLALLLLFCTLPALGEEAEEMQAPAFRYTLSSVGGSVELISSVIEVEDWLFLPSYADIHAVAPAADIESDKPLYWLNQSTDEQLPYGESVDWPAFGDEVQEGVFRAVLVQEGSDEALLALNVTQSSGLRTLFLFSDDPVEYGRLYIDHAPHKHSTSTTASMALVGTDGAVNHSDHLRSLRGRGNSTWHTEKKSYQLKLENKADLLNTGLDEERNRTWVLLAEDSDSSFLHNRIVFDLCREFGMPNASYAEHVDLYYDGEYRGLYVLCEKSEVASGRVDILDYDELMESWNSAVGQYDLEALPAAEAANRYGQPFSYIDGVVDSGRPNAGGYFLELEAPNITLSDRCWFYLSNGSLIAMKNPENPSEAMVRYISEKLEEALQTLKHGGVNPDTGRTIEDDFDVEAFARLLLINELCANVDGYSFSSSFFVLPEGGDRFEPGPPWDFDLSLRFWTNGKYAGGAGLKNDGRGWMSAFYGCPSFLETMQRLYQEELYPLITDILLGDGHGTYLRPIDEYAQHILTARRMNMYLWGESRQDQRYFHYFDFDKELSQLRRFLTQRNEWLYQNIMLGRTDADSVILLASANYGNVAETFVLSPLPWSYATVVSTEWEQLTEADEENYAMWRMEAVIAPAEGSVFQNPVVTVNGTQLSHERLEDGTLRISAEFPDMTYRPVDYYGEDIGLIYNPDFYMANYPEVVELCENDPEMIMSYFYDEGTYLGHMGNGFFYPKALLDVMPQLEDYLGTDWYVYYFEFLSYGYDEGWADQLEAHFYPEMQDAL